ncbi:unnamed protein product [Taenia asiatica]|uniref:Uncharacterized protein n=1 Tax=Taenia asiatica TaxID=60517 RepID=A0A3P6NMM9_TAEAS|nr:unnamed protein product [Taenia asiatica]
MRGVESVWQDASTTTNQQQNVKSVPTPQALLQLLPLPHSCINADLVSLHWKLTWSLLLTVSSSSTRKLRGWEKGCRWKRLKESNSRLCRPIGKVQSQDHMMRISTSQSNTRHREVMHRVVQHQTADQWNAHTSTPPTHASNARTRLCFPSVDGTSGVGEIMPHV